MSAVSAVYRVECRKLIAQNRVRTVLAVLVTAPWIFIVLLLHQDRLPLETLYGRYLTTTGYATSLVTLVFATQWVFPLIASLISGDIFSSEEAHGTLKTILTRSVGRDSVFWGKLAAAFSFTVLAVGVLAVSSMLAGLVSVGGQPVTTVGATLVPGDDRAVGMVAVSWAIVVLPVLGFAAMAVAVSIVTRSSVLGVMIPVVVGLVMQMYTFLNAWDTVRHLLLNTPMSAWRGVLDRPAYVDPLERGVLVALGYIVVATAVGFVVFRRRNVTAG
jgi:ABC-2 type transport system permease protein